jgi:hypothetical protein
MGGITISGCCLGFFPWSVGGVDLIRGVCRASCPPMSPLKVVKTTLAKKSGENVCLGHLIERLLDAQHYLNLPGVAGCSLLGADKGLRTRRKTRWGKPLHVAHRSNGGILTYGL